MIVDGGPDLDAIEKALRLALVTTSGLADPQVLMANQKARPGAGAYLTLKTDGPFTMGGPKGEQVVYDGTAALGQELTLAVEGPAELGISLQAFAPTRGGGGEAQSLLKRVRNALQLSSIRYALRAAGLTIFDFGRVLSQPAVYGADYEGRATLDLRAYVVEGAQEKIGYVAQMTAIGPGGVKAQHNLFLYALPGFGPFSLPAGTIVSTAGGLQFITQAPVTNITSGGNSPNVTATALVAGAAYNVSPGTIVVVVGGPAGLCCSNGGLLTTGVDPLTLHAP